MMKVCAVYLVSLKIPARFCVCWRCVRVGLVGQPLLRSCQLTAEMSGCLSSSFSRQQTGLLTSGLYWLLPAAPDMSPTKQIYVCVCVCEYARTCLNLLYFRHLHRNRCCDYYRCSFLNSTTQFVYYFHRLSNQRNHFCCAEFYPTHTKCLHLKHVHMFVCLFIFFHQCTYTHTCACL